VKLLCSCRHACVDISRFQGERLCPSCCIHRWSCPNSFECQS